MTVELAEGSKITTKLKHYGGSYSIRIPPVAVQYMKVEAEEDLEILCLDGKLVIRRDSNEEK